MADVENGVLVVDGDCRVAECRGCGGEMAWGHDGWVGFDTHYGRVSVAKVKCPHCMSTWEVEEDEWYMVPTGRFEEVPVAVA